jgi:hypothetical protein
MCSILCWILFIWEALGCMFSFWLDSCITNKRGIVSPIHNMGRHALCITRGRVLHHEGEKEGYSAQGENFSLHAFIQGELFVSPDFAMCFALLLMVSRPFASPWGVGSLEHFVSVVLSHCPSLRGPRLSPSSDLVLDFVRLLITCLSSLFVSFLFLSFMCCQCTHQGADWGPESPRTGGWSLLGVMSDWQRGVDWLLAEYCRCKLRLDLRWCRWRVSVKGLSLAGPPRSGETSRLGSMDPVAERDQVWAAWWQEKQDEVVYSFLVEPQNQGRAGAR